MGRKRSLAAWAGGLLMAAVCTGCSVRSAEQLYMLPRQSDDYYQLQTAIDRVRTPGSTYAGPRTGSNQQAVQLVDLDGDQEDEAVVFLKCTGEKPLKAYLFDWDGETYVNTATMEGEGSEFDSVEYAQLDGKPGMEIVLGRRLSDQVLRSLRVYSYTEQRLVQLMNTNYSEYQVADLDASDTKDVFVLRLEADERAGVAELYRYDNGVMERAQTASMTEGAKQIKRLLFGNVAQGVPAFFVASSYEEDSIVTDIFTFVGDEFCNLTDFGGPGLSAQTIRSYQVYATDIDEDGVIELPMPMVLPSAKASTETDWTIDWYNLTPEGGRAVKMSTYHNYSGGWYLVLPAAWHDQITVTRECAVAGVMGHTFSKWNGYGRATEEIMTIYAFSGDDRLELASQDGRFLLAEKGEIAYAASLGTCTWAQKLNQEKVRDMFHFIYMDWNSGER